MYIIKVEHVRIFRSISPDKYATPPAHVLVIIKYTFHVFITSLPTYEHTHSFSMQCESRININSIVVVLLILVVILMTLLYRMINMYTQ